MMELEYKHNRKYNPKSNRLENYDYSNNGMYFVTICCGERFHYFGEIKNDSMQLNQYGKIVHAHLEKLPMYYDYLVLDDYVVMPNHIHILVLINKTELDVLNKDILSKDVSEKHLYGVDDYENQNKNYYSRISAKKGSLGNIIKLFKGYVTKEINGLEKESYFAWQKNYHDRIVRNTEERDKIRMYIKNNPFKWKHDMDNEEGIFM